MPIKSFTFAFKLDAKELLNYIVERNIAVDIQATGIKRQPELLPAAEPTLALPAPLPAQENSDHNSRDIILMFMARHQEHKMSLAALRALLEQSHYSPKSLSNLIHILYKGGFVKKAGSGHYRITVKGLRRVEQTQEIG
jgi:hypothetical protein